MVITISCPSCATSFPVDPAKIPEAGVNVRCTSCGQIFRVERPAEPEPEPVAPAAEAEDEAPAWEEPEAEEPAAEAEDEWVIETEDDGHLTAQTPAWEEPEAPAEVEEAAPAEPTAPEPEPAPAAAPVQAFSFGQRDPLEKARRLARVLVSDMIMYNPERHEKALANGTLREDFEEEIEKSWKEFVEQVGDEIANGSDFWKDALNDVLAKGQPLF